MGEIFEQTKVKKVSFIELLKRIGPGIILAGVVIGPGNITTSAMLGANYGYSMIWLIIPIAFMGITFMLTSYRISMLTGMPLIHVIIKYYGKGAGLIVGIATFLSCLFFTMGNITGSGAGMNLIFGINWKAGSLIVIAITLICYFTKGVYSKVEKVITLCILGMIICFYATLVATGGPVWGELLVPFLGKAAPVVMGIALFAAGFSSLLGNTQRGMVLLGAGIEKPVNLESKFIRWGCLLCIAFAAVVCYSYGGSPTQLIFIANIATAIATPFGGFYVCRLIFRKDVNEGLKTPRVLQVCMVISYVFALVMTCSALLKMF